MGYSVTLLAMGTLIVFVFVIMKLYMRSYTVEVLEKNSMSI